jgi:hypothetical protein
MLDENGIMIYTGHKLDTVPDYQVKTMKYVD